MNNNPSQKTKKSDRILGCPEMKGISGIVRYFSSKNNSESDPRPYAPKTSSTLESLFKEKMTREELQNLKQDYLNPVFKNGFKICTIRLPSGHQKLYSYDEKERAYIKKV